MAEEKRFENKVKAMLKEYGCYFVKYWGGGKFTQDGVPDLLVCCGGYFVGIELKATHGRPSDLQLVKLKQITDAGGVGFLLYPKDYECFREFIKEVTTFGVDPLDLIRWGKVDPLINNWWTRAKELTGGGNHDEEDDG